MQPFVSSPVHQSWYNRVQILSDLHLEIGQQYASFTFPVTAPYLLLAGDIGRLVDYDNYLAFLKTQTLRYEYVFLVLGNHEFYGMSYPAALEAAQRLSDEPSLTGRLVMLNKTRWDSPCSSLTILGCTLWSSIPNDRIGVVQSKVSDYKKIDGWTPAKHNDMHAQEATWLRDHVAQLAATGEQDPRSVLVATHHAPCLEGTSRPEHAENPWSSAFATDMLASGRWDPVKTWVFGHTHYSTDIIRDGIRFVANQRGYVLPSSSDSNSGQGDKAALSNGFDPAKVITLKEFG